MTIVSSRLSPSSALPRFERVLFFPVTPFDADDRFISDVFAAHLRHGFDSGAGAAFVACGTGEYHALSLDEYRAVVTTAVDAVTADDIVLAGVGGPLGHARACAQVAEAAGVRGLLVMPPYLVKGNQAGLVNYVREVASATSLPLIAYHRGAATFTEQAVDELFTIPSVAGIKDGVGDIGLAQRFVLSARMRGRDEVQFFNGLLTAEITQAAYRAIGVPLYSSATFAMAPRIANDFYQALERGDVDRQRRLIDGFYSPLVRLRDETPGFAVSLVKAGLRLQGWDVGSVRAPLVDPDPSQLTRLESILIRGEELVG